MVFTINSSLAGNSPAHALSDFSELILRAHPKDRAQSYIHRLGDECFKLGARQEHILVEDLQKSRYEERLPSEEGYSDFSPSYVTRDALNTTQVLDLFQNFVSQAKNIDDDRPDRAFTLLRDRLQTEYYSGASGSAAGFFNKHFGWFDFGTTREGRKLQTISAKLKSLKPTPQMKMPKIAKTTDSSSSIGERVFTDKLYDSEAIGTISYGKSTIKWMAPGEYLRQVDPYFRRQPDEDSLPFLIKEMVDLADGEKEGPKFAPLMMNPSRQQKICDGYTILEHEGRHRALAAKQLEIPSVPVAIVE